jgi:hypothetical protein
MKKVKIWLKVLYWVVGCVGVFMLGLMAACYRFYYCGDSESITLVTVMLVMLMHLFAFGLGYFYYFLFDSGKNNKKGGE